MTTAAPKCSQCGYVAINSPPTIQPLSHARITHLLLTNDCLEEEEEVTFRPFISDCATQLARVRDRISTVKALLETLERTKVELESAAGAGKQILNPVRSIPTELLQKVFHYGAGLDLDVVDYLSSAPHSLDLRSSPWVYGRVCRRWKEISQKTAEIWTRIKIKDEGDANIDFSDSEGKSRSVSSQMSGLSFMSTYLGQSGTLPLSVYIDSLVNSASNRTLNYMYAISALLTSHAHRWEFLFLGKCIRGAQIDTKSLSEHSFPSLKRLCGVDKSCRGSDIGLSAPQLTSWSTLGDTNANGSLSVIPSTPLRSLITEYSSFKTSLIDTLRVVSLLPHLSSLFIRDLKEPNFAVGENEQPRVQMTKLKELRIDRSPANGTRALLHSISCPSLVHFSVNARRSLVSSFQPFEKHSKFQLRSLEISSQSDILDHQWITDSIEVLTVKGIVLSYLQLVPNARDMNSVLNTLSHQVTSAERSCLTTSISPFPNLCRLELHMITSFFGNVDMVEELITFITSRSGRNLEISLRVSSTEARKIFTHPRIDALRSMLEKLYILV